MNILDIPDDIILSIVNSLSLRDFYWFCSSSKTFVHNFKDEDNWKRLFYHFMKHKDPRHLCVTKTNTKLGIRLLDKSWKLTFAMSYKQYLVDKYTISLQNTRVNYLVTRRINIIESFTEPSQFDKEELSLLYKANSLYNKKINKHNTILEKFRYIDSVNQIRKERERLECYNKNQLRICLLIDFLCNDKYFEYNREYRANYLMLKSEFKKFSKRFTKILPTFYICELSHIMRLKYQEKLNKLVELKILKFTQNTHNNYGSHSYSFLIYNNNYNYYAYRYRFHKNDLITGLRFKS